MITNSSNELISQVSFITYIFENVKGKMCYTAAFPSSAEYNYNKTNISEYLKNPYKYIWF